jgi:hypothetical protein
MLLIALNPRNILRPNALPTSPGLNIRMSKLPRRNAFLKQDIQLTIRPSLRLRKSKVRPREAQETHARPEKSRFAFPVPGSRVEHVRDDDAIDDTHHVVDVAREHDGLGLEARGRDLGDETVADGADGDVVGECIDEEKAADSPACAFAVGDGDEANDEKDEGEEGEAVDVEGSAAGMGHEEPGAYCSQEANCVLEVISIERRFVGEGTNLCHGHIEGVNSWQASLLVEVCRVSHKGTATKILD